MASKFRRFINYKTIGESNPVLTQAPLLVHVHIIIWKKGRATEVPSLENLGVVHTLLLEGYEHDTNKTIRNLYVNKMMTKGKSNVDKWPHRKASMNVDA